MGVKLKKRSEKWPDGLGPSLYTFYITTWSYFTDFCPICHPLWLASKFCAKYRNHLCVTKNIFYMNLDEKTHFSVMTYNASKHCFNS